MKDSVFLKTQSWRTQNLTGIWNHTSRNKRSHQNFLDLDGSSREVSTVPSCWSSRRMGVLQGNQVHPKPALCRQETEGTQVHRLFQSSHKDTGAGAKVLEEISRMLPGSHHLWTSSAGPGQDIPSLFKQNCDLPIPKSHWQEAPKVKERKGREGQGERGKEAGSDFAPEKEKSHKAFPFLPFAPPMCVIYLVTELWMLIERIKGIITQSRKLFCYIFKLAACLATYSWTRTGKRSPWNKNKGARGGKPAPTREFTGFPRRKGQLPSARQFGINAIVSGGLPALRLKSNITRLLWWQPTGRHLLKIALPII